jgi:alpha-beta hydrolase superfamily lysophospholipase
MTAGFTERAVLFGRQLSLVGILTRPAAPARNDEPAIVILNTGIVHRVGHHRMYVALARVLARAGRTVLRFDFSGIGDSDQGSAALSPLDACRADIKDALDFLDRDYGVYRSVLIGLCSGSDNAIFYGYRDPRVVGLVLMDPSIPPTARYYFHYIAQRLTRLRHWISVATGRSGLLRMLISHLIHGVRPPQPAKAIAPDSVRWSPQLAESYQRSVECGIQMLVVFTLSSLRQTYREQLIDAFPDVSFKDQLKLESFPDSDHLFTREKDRARLMRVIVDWLSSTPYRR